MSLQSIAKAELRVGMHYYLAASVDQEVINAGQVLKQQLRAETHALERREVVE